MVNWTLGSDAGRVRAQGVVMTGWGKQRQSHGIVGRRRTLRHMVAGSGLILAALPVVAQAQSATPQIPTREEIQRPALPDAPPPNEQIVSADDAIERAPCPLANPEFANVRITLRSVEFSSVEGIDPATLASTWSDRVGQDLPISVVCDIRDRAATIVCGGTRTAAR